MSKKEQHIYAILKEDRSLEVGTSSGDIIKCDLNLPHVITCVFDKPSGEKENGKVYSIEESKCVEFKGEITHEEAKNEIRRASSTMKGEGVIIMGSGGPCLHDFKSNWVEGVVR